MTHHQQTYPELPGHKGPAETGRDAAEAMKESAPTIRRMVLARIRGAGTFGLTSEELAGALGLTFATVQPRTSELREGGWIEDSGLRRRNASSGKRAIVWIACEVME